MNRGLVPLRCLQAATILVFAYLCVGELLPLPAAKASRMLQGWAVQIVVALALLSCLTVLLGSVAGCGTGGTCALASDGPALAASLLAVLNTVPVVVALATSCWIARSDNCPVKPGSA